MWSTSESRDPSVSTQHPNTVSPVEVGDSVTLLGVVVVVVVVGEPVTRAERKNPR